VSVMVIIAYATTVFSHSRFFSAPECIGDLNLFGNDSPWQKAQVLTKLGKLERSPPWFLSCRKVAV
jgi:transposase